MKLAKSVLLNNSVTDASAWPKTDGIICRKLTKPLSASSSYHNNSAFGETNAGHIAAAMDRHLC